MPDAFVATYFEGTLAAGLRVIARRDFGTLILTREDTGREVARWAVDEVLEFRERKDTGLLVLGRRHTDARLHVIGSGIIRDARHVLPRLKGTGLPKRILKKAGLMGAGVIASLALIFYVVLPSFAAQVAAMIPPERETMLGATLRGQLERDFGAAKSGDLVCKDENGNAALEAMTARVMGRASLPYPLDVVVFDDALVNAYALPGGHVVLFRGLIDVATHPDEVAAVLAHEIGHVAARDPTQLALQSAGAAAVLALVLGDASGGTMMLAFAHRFFDARYSQAAEIKADAYAHRRLQAAGLPPDALADLFERLRETGGEFDGVLRYFSSHPSLANRIEAAQSAPSPDAAGAASLSPAQWSALQQICG